MAALAASSLTPFVAGGPAFADNQFAVVGNWSVTQHDSGTCSLKTTFDRGTSVFVSRSVKSGQWVFIIANPKWTNLQKGKEYTVRLIMDGSDKWEGSFRADRYGDDGVLIFDNISENFLVGLMKRWRVDIHDGNGKLVTSLPLDNSFAAMVELVKCQAANGGGGGNSRPQNRDEHWS